MSLFTPAPKLVMDQDEWERTVDPAYTVPKEFPVIVDYKEMTVRTVGPEKAWGVKSGRGTGIATLSLDPTGKSVWDVFAMINGYPLADQWIQRSDNPEIEYVFTTGRSGPISMLQLDPTLCDYLNRIAPTRLVVPWTLNAHRMAADLWDSIKDRILHSREYSIRVDIRGFQSLRPGSNRVTLKIDFQDGYTTSAYTVGARLMNVGPTSQLRSILEITEIIDIDSRLGRATIVCKVLMISPLVKSKIQGHLLHIHKLRV